MSTTFRRAALGVSLSVMLAGCGGEGSGGDGGGPGDTTPPTPPSSLAVTPVSTTRLDLAWSPSTDAVGVTGYRVFRAGAQVATSATTSWSDTGLTAFTAYCYAVAAFDAAGNVSAHSDSTCGTTLAPPPAFSGYDLVLAEGAFWAFAWDYDATTGSQGSGSSTGTWKGLGYARLAAPITIAGKQAYPVERYGPSWLKDVGHRGVGPRWRWLATEGSRLLGSTDGATLEVVYDMQEGAWPGGGFFAAFPASTLVQAAAGTLTNTYLSSAGVKAERSGSQAQCQYFPGVGTICGDSSYTYKEQDWFAPGVGPLGYLYENSYNDCGGGFCSWGSWHQHVGLVASSFQGGTFTPQHEVEPDDGRTTAFAFTAPAVAGDVLAGDPGLDTTVYVPTAATVRVHDLYARTHAGGVMELRLSFEDSPGADLDLFVFHVNARGALELNAYAIEDNVASGDLHEWLDVTLAAGTYYLGVSGFTTPTRTGYDLVVR